MSWLFASGGQSIGASASASSEYSGLISFRIDWFDLLSVWGALKSLLQHHSSKASVLWCSAFFMVQLSHLYMATGKTIVFTNWTFFGKVISLVFNTLPRFSSFAVILQWFWSPRKKKFVTASTFSPSICHEVMGLDAKILVFLWWVLSQLFHFPLSPLSRGSLVPLHFMPLEWYHLHIWGYWYFSWQSWLQLVLLPAQRFST